MFGQFLVIPFLSFIWFYFNDITAFLVSAIQSSIYPLVFRVAVGLPKSRQVEEEADNVGLQLITKACMDPRYAVLVWEKFEAKVGVCFSLVNYKFLFFSKKSIGF